MEKIICPGCGEEFEVEKYSNGKCLNCDKYEYRWDNGWSYEEDKYLHTGCFVWAKKSICVLCGKDWTPKYKNLCECGGFCTWGTEINKPDSFTIEKNGEWLLKPPPKIIE